MSTSVLYGTQIFYFNPMIFRLENLSLVENIVKHIHFQDHIQELNALYQTCIIYLYFSFLADLNIPDTTFAECACYLFFNGQKWSFPLSISPYGFGHIYWRNPQWKTPFLCNVCLLKSMVKSLFKFNTRAVKQSSFTHLIIALM